MTIDSDVVDNDLEEMRIRVRTLTDQWRTRGLYEPRSDSWVRSFDIDFSKQLAEHGLIGMTWPVRYGGGGLSNVARLTATEEL